MNSYIFLILIGAAFAAKIPLTPLTPPTTPECTNSYGCYSSKPCCRDTQGQTIIEGFTGFGNFPPPSSSGGQCSSSLGDDGDLCDSSCGCKSGYSCYKPVMGVCCPPHRCYNATWVKQQQHYWANCHPPTCFYPP